METLDQLVTYAIDLTLGGGAFYIGGSLLLYLTQRWKELEPNPKTAVKIPLALKAQQPTALELERSEPLRELQPLEALEEAE